MNKYFNEKYAVAAFCVAASMAVLPGCKQAQAQAEAKTKTPVELAGHIRHFDFSNLNDWVDGSQNMDGRISYHTARRSLVFETRANTWDRPKVRTKDKSYSIGRYAWKVYLDKMGVGDMASVGAFIYHDNQHELDFEIGYGTSAVREKLQASPEDLIAYTTSQDYPFISTPHKIARQEWHLLRLDMQIVDNKYEAIWSIDDIEVERVNLEYGPEIEFYIFCSLENLKFIGDHIPAQDNRAIFAYVEIIPWR